ncbi:MAG: hypothetical protein MUF42_06750, partial [Cytophagaceae bacterium]|nr:hypothetical protein [Cytophagaceae bacterium]
MRVVSTWSSINNAFDRIVRSTNGDILGIDQYGYLLRKIDNAYNESVVAGDGVSRLLDGLGTGASFK